MADRRECRFAGRDPLKEETESEREVDDPVPFLQPDRDPVRAGSDCIPGGTGAPGCTRPGALRRRQHQGQRRLRSGQVGIGRACDGRIRRRRGEPALRDAAAGLGIGPPRKGRLHPRRRRRLRHRRGEVPRLHGGDRGRRSLGPVAGPQIDGGTAAQRRGSHLARDRVREQSDVGDHQRRAASQDSLRQSSGAAAFSRSWIRRPC